MPLPEQIDVALACGVSSLIADFPDPQANRVPSAAEGRRDDPAGHSPHPKARAGRLPSAAGGRRGFWGHFSRGNQPPLCRSRETGFRGLLAPDSFPSPACGRGAGGEASTADAFQRLADENPTGSWYETWPAWGFCRRAGLPAVADFSLNAVNDLSFRLALPAGRVPRDGRLRPEWRAAVGPGVSRRTGPAGGDRGSPFRRCSIPSIASSAACSKVAGTRRVSSAMGRVARPKPQRKAAGWHAPEPSEGRGVSGAQGVRPRPAASLAAVQLAAAGSLRDRAPGLG